MNHELFASVAAEIELRNLHFTIIAGVKINTSLLAQGEQF